MLTIKLEDLNRTAYKEYYVNGRKRLATATGCAFISPNHLVVTSLVGMKMYLYELDYTNSSHKLIQQLDTSYDSKPIINDLLDFDGKNRLITSNCDNGTQSIYKIENYDISFLKQITNKDSQGGFCHGVKFHPYFQNIICATIFRNCSINYIDINDDKLMYQINGDINFRPKDLAFIDKNKIIAFYTDSKARTREIQNEYIAKLVLYHVDL